MFELIKRHPFISTGVGIVLLLVIYYVFFSGGGSQQPILSQQAPDNSLQIATLAQQTALAQSNNALTAAQARVDASKTVSLAQIAATQGIDEKTIAAALSAHLNDNTTTLSADTIKAQNDQSIASIGANTAITINDANNYTTRFVQASKDATSVSLAGTAASINANNNATAFSIAQLAEISKNAELGYDNQIQNAALGVISAHPGSAIDLSTSSGNLTGISSPNGGPLPGQIADYRIVP